MPATLAVLSMFWLLTGVIALLNLDQSVRMTGLSANTSKLAVVAGAVVDMILGAAILYRPWARVACRGMAVLTGLYIVAGSVLRPDLWADSLGPMLKAVPILVLTFTATAVIIQPITGALLVEAVGWGWSRGWIWASIGLYVFVGLLWLPVVWMQLRMRLLARLAAEASSSLPPEYFKLFRLWFAFGVPAFLAVLLIIWLMLAKPVIPFWPSVQGP
jgi:uncharacterized membrane protein